MEYKLIALLFVIVFLASCYQGDQEEAENKNDKQPTIQESAAAKESAKAEEPANPVVSCEDSDGSDIYTYGKVVLYYKNEQKESFKDDCIEEGSIFPVFLTEYACNGLNASSKIYKCDRNCSKGACNR